MDNRCTLSSLAYQLSLGAVLCALVYMMSASVSHIGELYPLGLIVYAPLAYGLNRLFLRQQRTVRVLIIFNLCLSAIAIAILICSAGRYGIGGIIFAVIFLLACTANGAYLCITPPALKYLLLTLDASMILLIILISMVVTLEKGFSFLLPVTIAFPSALLGVVSLRLDQRIGSRELGFLGGAFAGLFVLVWLLISWVAAPAGHGVVALWNGFLAILKAIWDLIFRFLLFLSSLIPEKDMEILPLHQETLRIETENLAAENANTLLVFLLGFLSIAFLIALLLFLGRMKLVGKKTRALQTHPVRMRISLLHGLRTLLTRFAAWLRIRTFLWKNRSTAIGLYYILINKCRLSPWRKRSEETPREFLTRLQKCVRSDDVLDAALQHLTLCVDEALFSKRTVSDQLPQARLIRRKVTRVVGRQFVRNCASVLRAKASVLFDQ